MQIKAAAVILAAAAVPMAAALAADAPVGGEAPAPGASAAPAATTTRPVRTVVSYVGLTAQDVKALLAEHKVQGRWSLILSALTLAGVIWVGWSMRTLAKNQVELGKLIQAGVRRASD